MSPEKRRIPIKMIIGVIGCIILFAYIGYRVMSAMSTIP